jgi:CRP/FNR family transcriptional regulator, cyclic AMP receptor protein
VDLFAVSNTAPAESRPRRRPAATVPVVLADRELAEELDEASLAAAARSIRARLLTVSPGDWKSANDVRPIRLGLLILSGILTRTVVVGGEPSAEILGCGDVLRPWDDNDQVEALAARVDWRVLETTRLAVLDDAFLESAAPWPQITGALFARAVRRASTQAALASAAHVKRVDVRLIGLLWHLAERWGRVTIDGIVIPVPLTHGQIAAVVGAQRPSVTTAFKRLAERGVVSRDPSGAFVLATERAREELEQQLIGRRPA